ncbi:MAG: octaprenyl diphosphate synthase [Gammaproteobacteria bacterium]|nr:octaprenyl diphosphate synthase [Gammaproteobacteria bacterium]
MTLTASSPATTDFSSIRDLVKEETNAVDQLILEELKSDVVLINQIGHYIVNSGGKRLRPMLLLLATKALRCQGRDTANALWGNSASVLVGDYLYSRSFELMVRVKNLRIMDILSQTTTAIAEGEVLQLLNCNNPETTEANYLEVISRKTAILFSAALQLAAVLSGAEKEVEESMTRYGLHLGIAFQLIDDALDYRAKPEELGKNLGDDLADGKPTLPLIYAMAHASSADASILRSAIEEGNRDAFMDVFAVVKSTGAIEYTSGRAVEEADKAISALSVLPSSPYRQALEDLARFSVDRNY